MQDKIFTDNILQSKGYGIIGKVVMKDKELDPLAKCIYAYLVSYAGSDGACYPSRDLISSELKISKPIISKYLKQLEDNTYLTIKQVKKDNGTFSHNIYYINTNPVKLLKSTEYKELRDKLAEIHLAVYGSTDVGQVTPTINSILTINNNNIMSDKSDDTQKPIKKINWETVYNNTDNKYDDTLKQFNELWELYGKVGSKKLAFKQWYKLTDEQKEKAYDNIPNYFSSLSDLKYRKHMERYISQEIYLQEFNPNPIPKEKNKTFVAGGETKRKLNFF